MSKSRVTREDFSFYQRWQKALFAYDGPLPPKHTKVGLWAYCTAMAMQGTNGLGCRANDETIAHGLNWSSRQQAHKYKKLALKLGWFVWTGKYYKNKKILNINIPTIKTESPTLVSPKSSAEVVESKPREDTEVSESIPDDDPWASNAPTPDKPLTAEKLSKPVSEDTGTDDRPEPTKPVETFSELSSKRLGDLADDDEYDPWASAAKPSVTRNPEPKVSDDASEVEYAGIGGDPYDYQVAGLDGREIETVEEVEPITDEFVIDNSWKSVIDEYS